MAAGLLLAGGAPDGLLAQAKDKKFYNPKVGGKRLDGCYSFPGPCKTKQQSNAFCKMKGYGFAIEFHASNEFGAFQTKRLGDGGTCTASCTVMDFVHCYFDPEVDH